MENHSNKQRSIALLLALLGGFFGWHHYYAGNQSRGRNYVFTTISIIGMPVSIVRTWIDMINIVSGSFRDGNNLKITRW